MQSPELLLLLKFRVISCSHTTLCNTHTHTRTNTHTSKMQLSGSVKIVWEFFSEQKKDWSAKAHTLACNTKVEHALVSFTWSAFLLTAICWCCWCFIGAVRWKVICLTFFFAVISDEFSAVGSFFWLLIKLVCSLWIFHDLIWTTLYNKLSIVQFVDFLGTFFQVLFELKKVSMQKVILLFEQKLAIETQKTWGSLKWMVWFWKFKKKIIKIKET